MCANASEVPGTDESLHVAPSIVLSVLGRPKEPTWTHSLTDDDFFELFYDAGRRRGWALDQSSSADPRKEGRGRVECYEAGLTPSPNLGSLAVFWCHVGLVDSASPARASLTELASCLEEVTTELGVIDLVGLQATLSPAAAGASALPQPHTAASGPKAMVVVAPAVYGETDRATDASCRSGGLDLSEVSPHDLERHLSLLRSRIDENPLVAVGHWDAAGLGSVARGVTDDLLSQGTYGDHRITLIKP